MIIGPQEIRSPIRMNPFKVLVSIIHSIELIVQKAVDTKETEIIREFEGDFDKICTRVHQLWFR